MFGPSDRRKKYNSTVNGLIREAYQIAIQDNPKFPGILAYLKLIDTAWYGKWTAEKAAFYIAVVYYEGLVRHGYWDEATSLRTQIYNTASIGHSRGLIAQKTWEGFMSEVDRISNEGNIW
jgi:hypothetical protein